MGLFSKWLEIPELADAEHFRHCNSGSDSNHEPQTESDIESTLACAGRAGQSFPLFSQLFPLSPPFFVSMLGTPEKAAVM